MIQITTQDIEDIEIHTKTILWLENIIISENKKIGSLQYILCSDDYLLKINQEFLNHDYYTDIITFDYVKGNTISGDIFVSLQRISENASTLSKTFEEELHRVLAHGILHLCGYKDKSIVEKNEMRSKENYYLSKYYDIF